MLKNYGRDGVNGRDGRCVATESRCTLLGAKAPCAGQPVGGGGRKRPGAGRSTKDTGLFMGRMGNLGRMGIGSRGNRDTHWKGGGNDGAGMGQAVGDGRKRMSRGAKGGECGAKAPRTVAVGRTGAIARESRHTLLWLKALAWDNPLYGRTQRPQTGRSYGDGEHGMPGQWTKEARWHHGKKKKREIGLQQSICSPLTLSKRLLVGSSHTR